MLGHTSKSVLSVWRIENAEGRVLVVSYIMKSSAGGDRKNFNPTVSETVNCILQKQVSCRAVFPNRSAVPVPAARSHRPDLAEACSKLTVSWQSLEPFFWSNSISFSLACLGLENLESRAGRCTEGQKLRCTKRGTEISFLLLGGGHFSVPLH